MRQLKKSQLYSVHVKGEVLRYLEEDYPVNDTDGTIIYNYVTNYVN